MLAFLPAELKFKLSSRSCGGSGTSGRVGSPGGSGDNGGIDCIFWIGKKSATMNHLQQKSPAWRKRSEPPKVVRQLQSVWIMLPARFSFSMKGEKKKKDVKLWPRAEKKLFFGRTENFFGGNLIKWRQNLNETRTNFFFKSQQSKTREQNLGSSWNPLQAGIDVLFALFKWADVESGLELACTLGVTQRTIPWDHKGLTNA